MRLKRIYNGTGLLHTRANGEKRGRKTTASIPRFLAVASGSFFSCCCCCGLFMDFVKWFCTIRLLLRLFLLLFSGK